MYLSLNHVKTNERVFGLKTLLLKCITGNFFKMIVQNCKSYQFSLAVLYDKPVSVTVFRNFELLLENLQPFFHFFSVISSEEFLRVYQRSYISDSRPTSRN